MKLAALYLIFAVVATATNIGSQYLCVRLYHGFGAITLSMVVGTGIGLVVKYLLDKRYIFAYQTRDLGHDTRTFTIYTAMGLITTAIFWGFEFTFHWIFQDEMMRYVGGIIGLAIGYLSKYQLDRRFVFT